jgi:predicted DNA-binding transcriptional regulator YafY
MGKSSTQDTLKFVLDLLSLIPAAPRVIDVQSLKKQLDDRGHVRDARTLQRTLKDLQEQFPSLECRDDSKPYGWCWTAKALPITVPAMTLDQAIVLSLAKRVLPGAIPGNVERAISPYFDAAHATLRREVSASKAAKWPKKIAFSSPTFELKPMQIDGNRMATINQAIVEERWLEIHYRNATDFVTESLVKPLGLLIEGPRSYLVAQFERFDTPANPPRTLALSRIETANLAEKSFTYPQDFSIDEFAKSQPTGWGTGKQIRITLSVRPYLGRILLESHMSEDQTVTRGEDEDDDWMVEATVLESERLVWWLLSFGAGVEVLEPLELRERIGDELRASADFYVK